MSVRKSVFAESKSIIYYSYRRSIRSNCCFCCCSQCCCGRAPVMYEVIVWFVHLMFSAAWVALLSYSIVSMCACCCCLLLSFPLVVVFYFPSNFLAFWVSGHIDWEGVQSDATILKHSSKEKEEIWYFKLQREDRTIGNEPIGIRLWSSNLYNHVIVYQSTGEWEIQPSSCIYSVLNKKARFLICHWHFISICLLVEHAYTFTPVCK